MAENDFYFYLFKQFFLLFHFRYFQLIKTQFWFIKYNVQVFIYFCKIKRYIYVLILLSHIIIKAIIRILELESRVLYMRARAHTHIQNVYEVYYDKQTNKISKIEAENTYAFLSPL